MSPPTPRILHPVHERKQWGSDAVAYAAKMARIIWAMLVTGECYRAPDKRRGTPIAAAA